MGGTSAPYGILKNSVIYPKLNIFVLWYPIPFWGRFRFDNIGHVQDVCGIKTYFIFIKTEFIVSFDRFTNMQ